MRVVTMIAWAACLIASALPVTTASITRGGSRASDGRRVSLLREPGPLTSTASPIPALYFSPVVHTGELLGPVGNASSSSSSSHSIHHTSAGDTGNDEGKETVVPAAAEWYIAQWTNPSPFTAANLPPPGQTPSGAPSASCNSSHRDFGASLQPSWSVETAAARVCTYTTDDDSDRVYVQLASAGGDALECGKEFDMFLSPLGGAYPRYQPPNTDAAADGMRLTGLDWLNVSVDIRLDYISIRSRCGSYPHECSSTPDYGYITVGVPIHNDVSREQNFFQVQVYDSRRGECGVSPGLDACDASRGIGWYFKTLPVLGSNVAAAAIPGQSGCIREAGDSVQLRMSLLPILEEVVQAGHEKFGADGNLTNWFVSGLYVGHGSQGDTTMTTTVGNINIEAQLSSSSAP